MTTTEQHRRSGATSAQATGTSTGSEIGLPAVLGSDGGRLTLGPIAAVDVVHPGEHDVEVDALPGTFALDMRVAPAPLYRLVWGEGRTTLVPTGESSSSTSTRFVPVARLAPPGLDDKATERLAHALADVLLGYEEAP